jgi:hypothetical protein
MAKEKASQSPYDTLLAFSSIVAFLTSPQMVSGFHLGQEPDKSLLHYAIT